MEIKTEELKRIVQINETGYFFRNDTSYRVLQCGICKKRFIRDYVHGDEYTEHLDEELARAIEDMFEKERSKIKLPWPDFE